MKHQIALLIAIFLGYLSMSAQKSIDEIIKDIPDNKKCDVVYSEERNPKTKKTLYSKIIVNIRDSKLASKLENAFKKERKNATGVKMMTSKHYIKLTFKNSAGTSEYTFNKQSSNEWLLVVNKRGESLLSRANIDERYNDNINDLIDWQISAYEKMENSVYDEINHIDNLTAAYRVECSMQKPTSLKQKKSDSSEKKKSKKKPSKKNRTKMYSI